MAENPQIPKENPLINNKIMLPAKRFRLPSKGLFYTDGEIDDSVMDGEVEIYSMTAIDEINLRSPELLFQGTAIERVFKRCVPEVNKPLQLLAKDVDFILACLRVVSYGNEIEISSRCPICEEKQKEKNDLAVYQLIEDRKAECEKEDIDFEEYRNSKEFIDQVRRLQKRRSEEHSFPINLNAIITNKTIELDEEGCEQFTTTLSNGNTVKFTPFRMDTSVLAYQFQNEGINDDIQKAEEYITFVISSTVKEVDGITDHNNIYEWAKLLPIKLKNELQDHLAKVPEWGVDFSYTIECPECGDAQNASTLLNPISFFMEPSNRVA